MGKVRWRSESESVPHDGCQDDGLVKQDDIHAPRTPYAQPTRAR